MFLNISKSSGSCFL